MNNFEAWKKELTIDNLYQLLYHSCFNCPLFNKCQSIQFRMSKSCNALLKEWAESED